MAIIDVLKQDEKEISKKISDFDAYMTTAEFLTGERKEGYHTVVDTYTSMLNYRENLRKRIARLS